MKETPKYVKEVQQILANIHDNEEKDTGGYGEIPPENEIDMYVEEDRITLIPRRLHGIPVNEQDIIDSLPFIDSTVEDFYSTPPKPTVQPISLKKAGILTFGILLSLICCISIVFQLFLITNPYTLTVSLLARSQQVTITGTLNLGRALNPITLKESQTVPTSGKGHQDARNAEGYITFYNGQLQSVFVPAGTILTGSSGVEIETSEDANIPAANPPTWGIATVSAHAVSIGSNGNIASYDINQGCCNGVKAVNETSFIGGQDEKNFQSVAKSDIESAAAPLKSDLTASLQGALEGQLKQGEELQTLPCSPSVTSDHQIGQEATEVKVTISETCSGVAYNNQELTNKVTQLLTVQAVRKLGSGYSMLEIPQVSITQAALNHIPPTVSLSFKVQSAWIYAVSEPEQKHIKSMIAGKSKDEAVSLLASLPGIESVSMQSSGVGDDTMMPKNTANIRLSIIYV